MPAGTPGASKNWWIGLGLVLAAAGWIRLVDGDVFQFLNDQAAAAQMALDAVAGGTLPQTGILSSLGVPNPPGFVWLLIPAAAWTDNPTLLTQYIAVLSLVGVALCGLLGRAVVGPAVGLASSAFLGFGIWSIQYSRSIWAQDCLPFLTAACALALVLALERGSPALLAASCAILALALQVHMSVAAFAAAWILALAVGFRRRLLPGVWAGLALQVLLWLPYLTYLRATRFQDLGAAQAPPPVGAPGGALGHTLALLTGRGFLDYFLGEDAAAFEAGHPILVPLVGVLGVVVSALVLLGVWRFSAHLVQQGRSARDRIQLAPGALMLAWLAMPILLLVPSGLPTYPHYLIVSLPAQAFFAAVGLLGVAPSPARRLQGWAFLAVLAVAHGLWFQAFLDYVGQRPVLTGDYRISYRVLVASSRSWLQKGGQATLTQMRGDDWGRYLLEHEASVQAAARQYGGGPLPGGDRPPHQ